MRTSTRKLKNESGFTLIELLVVLIILGILSAVVTINISGSRDTAIRKACKVTIDNVEYAVLQYYSDYGVYPPTSSSDAWLTALPTPMPTPSNSVNVSTYLASSPKMVGSTASADYYFQYNANPTTSPNAYSITGYRTSATTSPVVGCTAP